MSAEAALAVTVAGLQTTVQDLGRHGWGRFGLPPGGALDDQALRWANLLAGNEPGSAALEVTLLGPTLVYEGSVPVIIALTGADFGATVNGAPLPSWRAFALPPGAMLALGACQRGARGYLAVAGGIATPPVFDSQSADLRAGLEGLAGRALQAGDRAPLAPPAVTPSTLLSLPEAAIPRAEDEIRVRVVLGPQESRFTEDAVVTFLSMPYTVTREADRMGLRLTGPALAFRDGPAGADIISEGLVTGTVQVPAHGEPIILLAAHQTTGGYARIATVITADLWRLGQARPGDRVRFRAIGVAEAQEAARRYLAGFDAARLVPVPPPAEPPATEPVASISPPATTPEMALSASPVAWTPAAVQSLLDRVEQLGLAEFTLTVPGLQLQVRRDSEGVVSPPPAELAPPAASEAAELIVTAPLLGVFYRGEKPGDTPFVQPQEVVEADQTLGLIEVMKTFQPVTAGRRARLLATLVEDGAAVEFGQPLFQLVAE